MVIQKELLCFFLNKIIW